MARIPNINPGGLAIPSGYVIGRISPGTGQQELISIGDLGRQMVAQAVVPPSGSGALATVATDRVLGNGSGSTASPVALSITAPAAGFTVSWAIGGITLALADDLAALEAQTGTGLVARTAANTYAQRTITGTANRITVTDGGGVAAAPSIDLSTSYVGQATITTLGTVATGTWQATKIGLAYGGSNADLSATGGASHVVQQASAGAAFTVGQLSAAALSNGTTGTAGTAVVLATSPSLVTPALGVATATSLDMPSATNVLRTSVSGLNFTYGGTTPTVNFGATNGVMQTRGSNNALAPILIFGKSRGTAATPGAVQASDRLMQISAYGDDGTTTGDIPVESVIIRANVVGTVAAGIVPAALTIQTMNAAGAIAQRAQIGAEGGLSVGTTTDGGAGTARATELQQISGTGTNGQFVAMKSLTQLVTIAAAATTDTTIQIPAGARVFAVSSRVTVAIPTAATFEVGINGAASRFSTGVAVAVDTTSVGTLGSVDDDYAAATAIRITPSATPATNAGRLRVTIHYLEVTPPTS